MTKITLLKNRGYLLLALALLNALAWSFPFYKFMEKFEPSGDEPHYLIITQSLIQDQDLDLRNNYLNKDYRSYYRRVVLEPNPKIVDPQAWYPICNIGLPLLSIPPFLIAERLGVSLFMMALSIFILLNIFLLVKDCFKSTRLAIIIWGLFVSSFPFLFYHFQIITEIPAALLAIYAYRLIMSKNTTPYTLSALFTISFVLPWIHIKYVLLAFCLILCSSFIIRNQFKTWVLGIPFILNFALIPMYYSIYFNDPLFLFKIHDSGLPLWLVWKGLLGLFFDQEFGLFFQAPIWTIFLSGIVLGLRSSEEKKYMIGFLLIFGLYWIACGSYKAWHGGWSFPTRYLIPVLPFLSIPMAFCLKNIRLGFQKGLVLVLCGLTFFIVVRLLEHPWDLYNQADKSSNWIMSLKSGLPSQFFPSFIDPVNIVANLAWIGVFLLINIGLIWQPRGRF